MEVAARMTPRGRGLVYSNVAARLTTETKNLLDCNLWANKNLRFALNKYYLTVINAPPTNLGRNFFARRRRRFAKSCNYAFTSALYGICVDIRERGVTSSYHVQRKRYDATSTWFSRSNSPRTLLFVWKM